MMKKKMVEERRSVGLHVPTVKLFNRIKSIIIERDDLSKLTTADAIDIVITEWIASQKKK